MGKCKCENCGTMFTDDDYEPGDENFPLVCDECYLQIERGMERARELRDRAQSVH